MSNFNVRITTIMMMMIYFFIYLSILHKAVSGFPRVSKKL